MIKFQLFPRSVAITDEIQKIIACFEKEACNIDSETSELKSNDVFC